MDFALSYRLGWTFNQERLESALFNELCKYGSKVRIFFDLAAFGREKTAVVMDWRVGDGKR